ncbi:MAG: hypothetical protein IJU31_04600 [Synergistaceae bacterium]|nr:hypothetical protein [Synergistaceae bacterium]
MAEPLAKITGNGEIFEAVKDILYTKLSVPSMSLYSDSLEVAHMEFAIDEEVKAEEGLMSKLVKLGRKFMTPAKVETESKDNK